MSDRTEIDPTLERHQSLWWIAASPLIWAVHFLTSYISAAIYCAKSASPGATLAPVRVTIAIATVLALAGIGTITISALRRHRFGDGEIPHDRDTRGDRHRFIGYATLLLSGLSATATVFVALVIVFVKTCH